MIEIGYNQRVVVQVQTPGGSEYRRASATVEEGSRYKDHMIHVRGYVAAIAAPSEIGNQYI